MALTLNEIRSRASEFAQHRRTKKLAIWAAAIVIAVGVLGGLAAPPLLRYLLTNQLTQLLHRPVAIEQIRINPYTMVATVRGFSMKERQSSTTAVSFEELRVNLELLSIFQRGLVLKELQLRKPYVNLIRHENLAYNFQDLIDEFTSGPPGPTPRFSLNNIEIIDGKIDFDDQPEQTKHAISSIKIGVPFISSIPSYADIKVKPAFSAVVNGAPLEIGGDSQPFKDSRDTALHFNIDNLQLPKYLEYSPVELNFKVPSGQLSGKLAATFSSPKGKAAVLSLSGNLGLKELAFVDKDDAPLLKLPAFNAVIEAYEVFANRMSLKSVKARDFELHLVRGRDGAFNVGSLIRSSPEPADAAPEKKESAPFVYRIDEILIESSKLHFTDQGPQRPYKTRLDNVRIDVKGLTSEADKKANAELSFESDANERFNHTGTLQLNPLLVEGKLEIQALKPGNLQPYYGHTLAAEIKDGSLDIATQYSFAAKPNGNAFNLSDLNATLRALRLELPGHPEPLWRIGSLSIKDAAVDVAKKSIVLGGLEGRDGSGYLQRDADGKLSYARLTKTQPAEPPAPAKKEEAGWNVQAKQISLDRFKFTLDDRTVANPAKTNLSDISIRGENFSNAKNQRGKLTVRTKVHNKGTFRIAGTAGANPVNANLIVEGQDVELLPFQSYLTDQLNFLLTGGRIGTKGKLTVDGSGSGPAKVNYDGSVQVHDLAAVEKNGSQDLLKWKTLNLEGLQFASEPTQVRISDIYLADFYSRLVLGADGKINLQKLTNANTDDQKEAAQPKASEPAVEPVASQPAAGAPAKQNGVSIGKIHLQGGNINFSDFFVKPNYSANLTNVQGSIAELKQDAPGDLDIAAKLDNAAPVDIKGKINPLSKDLYLDIVADAKEIELNPFSTYSGKYVGYGIEKGKLSFNVKYKVENRKLSAENKIILNQLTFGERVESPDATKLPVLLAVALLKDRNGVIDIDLPIGGSLDDPQFSVGGIVLRLVINIITRAVTAPFALLGAAFGGGGGQELSYIEFDYGRTQLTPSAEARIKTLATAMNNRPALKIEISGRADPVQDLEGLKRLSIERKVKAQKMKELVRQGTAPQSVDEVQVDKAEYERYLKAAYGEEKFPKPRNVIGLAKDLPVAEMESLMLKHAQVTDSELSELANRRAQIVRDRLLSTGLVETDRLFIVGAKAIATEDKETVKAKTSRVDFSLK